MSQTTIAGFFTTLSSQMVRTSLGFLCLPWKWFSLRRGDFIQELEQKLAKYLGIQNIYSFWNGRSALYHGLKLSGVKEGDEVILQAYTCVSVPNAIIQTGARPVYCDINGHSLNIDPDEIEKKITARTKAIIVQHTFGLSADLEKITGICHRHKIYLVEDCAHSLGSEFKRQKLGSFGDIAIFSLGRDKVISSVTGGFLVINNPDLNEKYVHRLEPVPFILVIRALCYPILAYLARLTYDWILFEKFTLGKGIMFISRRLGLFPEILDVNEKKCANKNLHYSFPNCLAQVGLQELAKIEHSHQHRQEISKLYLQELSGFLSQLTTKNYQSSACLRYVIFIEDSQKIIYFCRQYKIILGDWYRQVIAPRGADLKKAGYQRGSCLTAEKLAAQTINLPSHTGVSIADARKVIATLKKFFESQL